MPTLVAVSAAPMNSARLRVEAEPDPGHGPTGEGDGDPDDRHEHGRPADAAELGQVHLHADLHEQQQHTELGEDAEAHPPVAGDLDEAEDGGTDEDAGEDLAEHGGQSDALGSLGGELRRGDHDQEVEQQSRQVEVFQRRRRLSSTTTRSSGLSPGCRGRAAIPGAGR